MIKAKIVEQDGSFFLDLTELVQSCGLKVGDEIDLIVTDTGVELRSGNRETAKAMKVAIRFMNQYPAAMNELAK